MTVSAVGFSGPTWVQYPGNGTAAVFSFPFLITAATDLAVGFLIGGAYALQTSGYAVSGVGNVGGGQVTFTTAPPLGTTVDIRSQIPETQPTNFANLGGYLPESTTNAVDRITRLVTDLYRLTYQFGIHGPDQENTPWPQLPAASVRANTGLVFDANGLPGVGILTSNLLTQALFNAFLNTSNLYGGTIPQESGVTVMTSLYAPGDVRRYAALGTFGIGLDDSAAWLAMFTVGVAGWGSLFVPGGTSLINTAITIPRGGYWTLNAYNCVVTRGSSCTGSAITLNTGGNAGGVTIRGLTCTDAVFNSNPWMLLAYAVNTSLLDCSFQNSYLPIQLDNQILGNDGTGSIQTRIERCTFYSSPGGGYGIVLKGQQNATNILSCSFINTNIAGVYIGTDSGFITLADSVLIMGCWFQGAGSMVSGIQVSHATATGSFGIYGLKCIANRFETMTQAYLFDFVPANDSYLPPFIMGTLITNVSQSVNNQSNITVNQWDFGVVPLMSPSLNSYGGFVFKSYSSGIALNTSVGNGFFVENGATQNAFMGNRASGGGLFNLPNGGSYEVNGTQVVGAQQTTGVASATLVANSGTALNSASTFNGYTVAQIVKAMQLHGLLA
jgi:hypothetical protein